MKLLLRWLAEHVRLPFPVSEVPQRLSELGIEVEEVVDLSEGLRGYVVAGKVRRVYPHPRRAHLRVLEVFVGEDTLTLVSAAPPVEEGKILAVALPGARLRDGREIQPREFDEVVSQGMALSEAELGLAAHSEGLLELPPEVRPGEDPLPYLQLDDWLLDLYITPNRPDLMGVRGLARELTLVGGELLPVDLSFPEVAEEETLPVEVEDPTDCPRYLGRVVAGVEARPSPPWMRYRLALTGTQPRNLLVDVTNYVLFEMGHPLHAFDREKLAGGVVVRRARPGERLQTLDGEERLLDPETLVIADRERAVALAGVMGGLDSAVSPSTRTVFLESALFDPPRIRHAVLRYGLHTESARRFERGLSFPSVEEASRRALHLYAHLIPGVRIAPAVDVYREAPPRRSIFLSRKRFARVAGVDLPEEDLARALQGVGEVRVQKGGVEVEVAPHRVDLHLPEDLVEEVLRIRGYDTVPPRVEVWNVPGRANPPFPRELQDVLHRYGLTQTYHLEFVAPEDNERFGSPPFVTLRNPLGHQFSQLRASLLPGLLRAVSLNLRHGRTWVGLYEIGTTFHARGEGKLPREVLRLGVVLTGRPHRRVHWGTWEPDFPWLKGVLDELVEVFGLTVRWEGEPGFLEGGGEFVAGEGRGWIGRIRQDLLRLYDIKVPVFAMEWELPPLRRDLRFVGYPQTPIIYRDLSVLVPRDVRYAEVREALSGWPDLVRVELLDVYEGDPLPPDRRSLTFRLVFQHPEETLTDARVDRVMEELMQTLQKRGWSIRGR